MIRFDPDGLLRFSSAEALLENERASRGGPARPATAEDLVDVIVAGVRSPDQRPGDNDPARCLKAVLLREITGETMSSAASRCKTAPDRCYRRLRHQWAGRALARIWSDVKHVTGPGEQVKDHARVKYMSARRCLVLASMIAQGLQAIAEDARLNLPDA